MKRYIALVFVLCLVCACGANGATPTPAASPMPTQAPIPTQPPTWLTLDGRESDGTLAVTQINLWKDYDNRGAGVAGVGKHGERVELIRRSGDGVQIELTDGTRGWVTYYFIKEYK